MNQVINQTINGVNVEQLLGTIDAVKGNAEIAQFTFRSTTQWINGGHCQTRIKEFYGATQEDTSRADAFVIDGDEPAVLLGSNEGANAVEAVLHAVASCLSVGIVYNASALGIKIEELSIDIHGDLDLHAFLGLSETTRPGYKSLSVEINAKSSATINEFEELLTYVKKTSPVLDIIQNPVPVSFALAHNL